LCLIDVVELNREGLRRFEELEEVEANRSVEKHSYGGGGVNGAIISRDSWPSQ
jgi:hypothetical protein